MKKNIVGFFKDNKLLTGLYFVFLFLLCTTTYVGFSGNVEKSNVKVKSVTPEYDESSTIVMNGNDVTFNDKDQEVKYKVVLENTEGHNLTVSSVDLTTPTESFLSYTIENLKKDDVINANSTKEVTVTLKTTATEGWGRNFNDELTANITFAKNLGTGSTNQNVGNPVTGDGILLTVLIVVTSATGLAILIISKKKFVKYMVLTLMLSPVLTLVKADTTIQLPITIKASFESQNVMKATGCLVDEEMGGLYNCESYWGFVPKAFIKNFYIQNEITPIDDVKYEFDASNEGNGRVKAFIVENESDSLYYDLYLQADGVIYANSNASFYFASMSSLEMIDNLEGLDTSKVTDMTRMFQGFGGAEGVNPTLEFKNFDTSNVTNMSYMFSGAGGWTYEEFTLDLGDKFDTSNVTDMSGMFSGTGYYSDNYTLDLGDKFDTSNVTDMSGMFNGTGYYCDNFTLDLGDKFDTSNVTNMSYMFMNTGHYSTKLNFTITIKNPGVTDYSRMFYDVATIEGSQIKVNYTSETESLVEQMINTKSTGANVVKGVLVD